MGGLRWPDHRVRQVQRRTLTTLVATQALGGLGITIGIAVAALLAEQISGSEKLAGLAQTTQVLGAAIASLLLAHLMGRRGRRPGLTLGYLLGASGGALCVVAGVVRSFPLLLIGTTLLGATTAANSQSRYAAIDLAAPDPGPRAVPGRVGDHRRRGRRAEPDRCRRRRRAPGSGCPADRAVPVGLVGMLAAAVVLGVWLRRTRWWSPGRRRCSAGARSTGTLLGRALPMIKERPAIGAGIARWRCAHAVMVAVMVMTPLHMHHGGASLEIIGVVISVHVLGMFALAPVVGWAADRFGRPPVLGAGAGVLLLALLLAGTAPMGASVRIGAGLFLLGLGWSFCTVAASTLLSESTPLEARTDVQGVADLTMGVVAAAAGALGGVVVGVLGYGSLNLFAAMLVAGVATAAEFARRTVPGAAAQDDEPPAL